MVHFNGTTQLLKFNKCDPHTLKTDGEREREEEEGATS